jgi:membrane protease YdiL (CAAX protease family)
VWGWEDAALLAGAFLPAFALSLGLMRLLRGIAPEWFKLAAVTNLTFQLLVYLWMVGALYLIVSFKYRQPFWTALGWTLAFRGALLSLLAGPVLAVGVSTLGVAIRTPEVRDPIREMITGRTSLAVVILFGVVIAPFVEEMFFRGFLFPLVARSVGPWASMILTAVLFAVLHGAQYEWAWQQLVLIGLAGVAFGFARYRTGATTASFLIHAGFNAVQFAGFLLTR